MPAIIRLKPNWCQIYAKFECHCQIINFSAKQKIVPNCQAIIFTAKCCWSEEGIYVLLWDCSSSVRSSNLTGFVAQKSLVTCTPAIDTQLEMRSTRKLCRPSDDILCGRPDKLWPFELTISSPVTAVWGNVQTTFGFFYTFFVFELRDGRTDGRTKKTRNAAYFDQKERIIKNVQTWVNIWRKTIVWSRNM